MKSPENKPKFQRVSTKRQLEKLLARLKRRKHPMASLDFETTGLDPYSCKVRLGQICNDQVAAVIDFFKIRGGFPAVAHLFEGVEWIVFNAKFELRWFYAAKITTVKILDVAHLRHANLGGGNYRLAQIILWDLEHELSKELQASDWGVRVLSDEQIDYATDDAFWTWKLWKYWSDKTDAEQWKCFTMLNDMVPAVIEMEDSGMTLECRRHDKLDREWEKIQANRVKIIRKLVPETEVEKISSDTQWSDYFLRYMPDHVLSHWPRTEKTGQLSMTNETLEKLEASFRDTPLEPLFKALREWKTITKYRSSFGQTLITKAQMHAGRRIHARFNIAAAKTCRFSCSGPNLQQIPRDRELLGEETSVRRSFVAGLGRQLVSLDYSGIELRVLALLAEDDVLLNDLLHGDVHSEVASFIAGRKIDKSVLEDKRLRQDAKPVSFGIIYGSGAAGLSINMKTTPERASEIIDFWAGRYSRAFELRYDAERQASSDKRIRCVDGGTIYMRRPDLPKCANYPVQRGALSVMAKAIKRHKDTLDAERAAGRQRATKMLATIHDQLIDEPSRRDAPACLELMREDMTQAYLDVFPGAPTELLIEGGLGPSWGELTDVAQ